MVTCTKDLVRDVGNQHDALLVGTDRREVPRPQLDLVLWDLDGSRGIKVLAADRLELQHAQNLRASALCVCVCVIRPILDRAIECGGSARALMNMRLDTHLKRGAVKLFGEVEDDADD